MVLEYIPNAVRNVEGVAEKKTAKFNLGKEEVGHLRACQRDIAGDFQYALVLLIVSRSICNCTGGKLAADNSG